MSVPAPGAIISAGGKNQQSAPSAAQSASSPSVLSGNLAPTRREKSSICAVLNRKRLSTGQPKASTTKTTSAEKKNVAR